jgi:hypothetical protein
VVPRTWGWLAVAIYVLLDVALITGVVVWSRRTEWSAHHRLALAGGAALAYAWHAFIENPAVGGGGASLRIGNAVFAVGLILLLVVAVRRNTSQEDFANASAVAS